MCVSAWFMHEAVWDSLTVSDTHLWDGYRVVGEGLPLRQLCILSFQRRQFLPFLQTSGSDVQVHKIKYLQYQHAKNALTFCSMTSKLFFSLWKFSLSCWACKVICEDCFFSVMILSCDKQTAQYHYTTPCNLLICSKIMLSH